MVVLTMVARTEAAVQALEAYAEKPLTRIERLWSISKRVPARSPMTVEIVYQSKLDNQIASDAQLLTFAHHRGEKMAEALYYEWKVAPTDFSTSVEVPRG